MKVWMKIAIAAILAAAMVAFVCLIMIFPKENNPKMIQKMDIEKYASPALTVSEGGEITYTVRITSRAGRRALLVVKDTLPENTVLVGGDFVAEGSALSAEVTVKAKGSVSVSYTVRLGDAYTNGSYVNAPAASIGDKKTGECKSPAPPPTFSDLSWLGCPQCALSHPYPVILAGALTGTSPLVSVGSMCPWTGYGRPVWNTCLAKLLVCHQNPLLPKPQ